MISRIMIALLLAMDFYSFLKQYKSGKELYCINSIFYKVFFKNPIFDEVFKRFINFTNIDDFRNLPFITVSFLYSVTIISFVIDFKLVCIYLGIYLFLMSFFKLVFYIEDKRNGVK